LLIYLGIGEIQTMLEDKKVVSTKLNELEKHCQFLQRQVKEKESSLVDFEKSKGTELKNLRILFIFFF
jgi:hypothetical protein